MMGKCKVVFTGTHPDSLYRVSSLGGGVGGGPWTQRSRRLRSICRLLKWPIALTTICVSLALVVYFLIPETSLPLLVSDNVNSTEWIREEQPYKHSDAETSESRFKGDSNSIETTTIKNRDSSGSFIPATQVSEVDLIDIFEEPKRVSTSSPPIFPTNISPSVQYGNENQDEGSGESRTPKKPTHISPATDIYDDKFLTQTFAIFYNKDVIEATTRDSHGSKNKDASTFTSGHQNSFGIPIEEAERLKSTTQSAVYNTKVSPTLPSMTGKNKVRSTTVRSRWNATEDGLCHSTRLSMCRGVLPYDLTTLPLVNGITTFQELDAAVPYFDYILKAGCSPRTRQFICSLLEPECKPKGMKVLPPCRRACKAIVESCQDVIAATLELSQVFNCQQYPDQESECVTLARGVHCLTGEIRCPVDGSCIPAHWRCDNINDCPGGTDEAQCDDDQECAPAEFRCGTRGTCIPEEWVCDGHQDCPGSEDESSCLSGDGDVISAASYHPKPVRLPRPVLRPQPLPESARYTGNIKTTVKSTMPEYESSSKELLMMSDSVLPVIKPVLPSTNRKKPGLPNTTFRTTIQPTGCPKYDPSCRKNKTQPTETTTEEIRDDKIYDPISGTSHSSPCPDGELRCVDGRCITLSQLCDRQVDCSDGADEANCST